MTKIKIIILAAGLGKRMANKELPKVLVELRGKPLIKHLLEVIKVSEVDLKPVIVVVQKADLVKAELGPDYTYIMQPEQLGTGHAVMVTKDELKNKAENIFVLYGDQPLMTANAIQKITETHLGNKAIITMGTVKINDFADWRECFYDFGRIIRDSNNKVIGIIEKKDASVEQLEIKEVNPSYFCFKANWLWNNLEKIKNSNSQSEYYLTDLIEIACQNNEQINTIEIAPKTGIGINTEEQLKIVENLL